MMRNVAIGAVLGFGLVVLFLSVFKTEAPPPAPPAPVAPVAPAAPAAAAVVAAAPEAAAPSVADGGPATALIPVNAAPVIVTPSLRAIGDERRLMMREMLREHH